MSPGVECVESRTGIGKADAMAIHGLKQTIESRSGVGDVEM